MSVTRIATRYAKSLLDLAVEQGKLEQVHSDMTSVHAATQNRDLLLMFKSPIIHADKKNAIVDAVFKGKIDDLSLAYIKLLVDKNREGYLPEIATEFEAQYKTLKKITTVKVTTALPVDGAVLDDLRSRIISSGVTHGNVDIVTKVDPKLIGGFVLEFDNKRYDASVQNKLETLKGTFTKNLYIKEF